ncbi:hypothetical protein Cgig2_000483 [Carnegiea gigantea]|uniref:EF-hand domain-containing protein n=1 Tax=Carnegiea gigantea TaxID=171969 RepID=A0A9Q1JKW0_9CARY|nr:hypothetical protein Cgig2_000483 [Carnegiea gigantea]
MEKAYENANISSFLYHRCELQPSKDCEKKSKESNNCHTHEKRPISGYYEEKDDDCYLIGQDINKVMETLGIQYNLEGDELKKVWGRKEISCLFEEVEPSLQELWEAFEVFDQNRDGFIDARELRSVLCRLGLRKGSDLQECKKMIRASNENGDDKMDFKEFATFMLENF